MAVLFPPYALDPEHLALGSDRIGLLRERETLQLLANALPPSYSVFHSTHLAWLDDGLPRKREADFLVVNQTGDVLMVEQKTGKLDETTAGLMKSYGGVPKSVVTQCHEITDALRARFREAYNGTLNIGFVLFCPDHVVRNIAAAGITAGQIVDATKRRGLVQAIRRLLPERRPDPVRFDQVRKLLTQTLGFAPDAQAQAAEGGRVLTRLTDGLLGFLTGLEMTPYRLRIDGAAGCGKTQMVMTFATRWQSAGRRVLVACYNRPLADELRQALPGDVEVDTIHGIARRLLESSGTAIDVATQAHLPGFWPRLLGTAIDKALGDVPMAWRYDALVVDEGQDVDQEGFDLLRLLLPDQGDIVWMADENQRLYATVPFASTGFVTYRCLDNYRSPQRIARFLQALLPISFVARNPTPGDPVHVHEVAATAVTEVLATRIERLLDVGYTLAQIVVLTGKGQAASEVMGAERIGRFPVRRFVGFTADGSARYTAGDLRIETLWRFKGQQAPAVLVCELDGDLADQSTVRRLYCAATRASMHLEILVARGSALLSPLHPAAGQANAANMA